MSGAARSRPERGAGAPLEVEAKLTARSERALRAIADRVQIGAYRLTPLGTLSLASTYYDTRTLTLTRHAVALRVRSDGDRWEATAKWSGRSEGVLHSRPELTVRLAGPPPAALALPPVLHEQLCALVAGRPLRPLLHTEINRQRFLVLPASSVRAARPLAELALDTVIVRPPRRTRVVADRYCEVEIERLGGTTADVLALAATLQREFHLRPSTDSKFGRGLAAVHNIRLASIVTDTVARTWPLEALPRATITRQLARLRAKDVGVRRGIDAEAVHDMRVAVRRLRTALRVFHEPWPPSQRARLQRELRWLGRLLGEVRDRDVQLERLGPERSGIKGAGIGSFLAQLRAERLRAREVLLANLNSQRYFRLLRALETCGTAPSDAGLRPPGTPAPSAEPVLAPALEPAAVARRLRHVLRRSYARLQRAAATAARNPTPVLVHAERIRAKRLRYAVEFLDALAGKPGRRLVADMTGIQDLLGAHQDAVVAAAWIRAFLAQAARRRRPRAGLEELLRHQKRLASDIRRRMRRRGHAHANKKNKRAVHAILARLQREPARPAAPPLPSRRAAGTVTAPTHR